MENPIYREYYSHEGEDCYKMNLPWSEYKEEKIVLCRVSESYDYAKNIAIGVLMNRFIKAIEKENTTQEEQHD